ncbi:dipeptide ABC transporter ATP-binding protein [soil metagenome]
MSAEPLLRLVDLYKSFSVTTGGGHGKQALQAVAGVSLELRRGQTLGLVGESGCGKSTLARCVVRLHDVDAGQVLFDGQDITQLAAEAMLPVRRRMQMVFQDPYGSLNPRRRVGSIMGDPFAIHGIGSGDERKRQVQELMARVGLNPEHYNRFPGEFSGGQRQRIGIARAIALRPELIVCDEPVSALDVSIQAQVLNLLDDLQSEFGLSYLFISHDLSVVRHVSDHVAVMHLGRIVEVAPSESLYEHARHPYTRALLSAIPATDPEARRGQAEVILSGDPPSPLEPPSGCRFHPRCPRAQVRCSNEVPALRTLPGDAPEHQVACHFPLAEGDTL